MAYSRRDREIFKASAFTPFTVAAFVTSIFGTSGFEQLGIEMHDNERVCELRGHHAMSDLSGDENEREEACSADTTKKK